MKVFTNGKFEGSYRQVRDVYFENRHELPRNHPENWPDGPWTAVEPEPAPPPTPEQIRAELQRERERDAALDRMTHAFADGRVIQCRPRDEQPMRAAIDRMQRTGVATHPWILSDNSHSEVSVADLEEAIISGQDQGAVIFAEFMAADK